MTDDTLRAALDAWEANGAPNRKSLAAFGIVPTLASAPDEGPDREWLAERLHDEFCVSKAVGFEDDEHGHHYPHKGFYLERADRLIVAGFHPAAPVALDVERLARAMRFVYDDPDLFGADVMDNATVPGAWTEIAIALAREYAALQEQPE